MPPRTNSPAPPAPSSSSLITRPWAVDSGSSAASAVTKPRSSSPRQPFARAAGSRLPAGTDPSAILSRGEVSEWLMVPLSKSGVRKHRGFESRPLRQLLSPRTRRERSPNRHADGFWDGSSERSPSGLWRRTGNAVRGNASGVRIPPSPPQARLAVHACPAAPSVVRRAGEYRYTLACRARRGTSGALYLQSAPAGLNPSSRPPRAEAATPGDVEDRVPRSGESRTVSGPEGSSTQRSSSGAAERPDPSRLRWWARVWLGRQGVHGTLIKPASGPRGAT